MDPKRISLIEIGEIYFWTATINKWQNILENDSYKDIAINSLEYLSQTGKIDVFALAILPNHIHLIWRIKENNGKETSQGSFLKYTAHEFKKKLIKEEPDKLSNFYVDAKNKNYEFWQRDPMAIHLYTPKVAFQKLDYIHLNPLGERWQLVTDPNEYKYSTSKFYELGIKEFSFIKDLRGEF